MLALLLPASFLLGPAYAGSLQGTVTTEAGDALAGVELVAYDERLNYGTATSTNDGTWSMNGLPAGRYRVRAMPGETSIYADRFYPDTWDFCTAAPVQVLDDGTVDGIDIALPEGGTITGRITDLTGAALAGAEVDAKGVDSRTALASRSTVTDADGNFVVTGLDADPGEPTDWQCYVSLDGFPAQWLGSTYSDADATIYAVSLPAEAPEGTATGDNALLDGITVTGLVTGPDGAVSDGTAYVYSPSQVLTETIGADGVYVADGLPPGDVIAWATVSGLATTYWPDSDRPTTERVSTPDEGAEATADLNLPDESVLTLSFTDASGLGRLGDVSVLLYNDEHTVGRGGPVDDDGNMVIDGLWPGTYDLYVYGADGGFEDGYAFEGSAVDGATTIEVPLVLGASISGRLTDDAGEGVYGGYVYAFPADNPDESYAVVADSDGYYSVGGLPEGFYSIRASYVNYCPTDRGFVTVWWSEALSEDWAAQVQLAQGQAITVDFALPDDDDHDAMGDAWERDHGLDTSRDDSNEDLDGDGFTNLEEYLLGSDPNGSGGTAGVGCKGCQSTTDPEVGLGLLAGMAALLLRERRPQPRGQALAAPAHDGVVVPGEERA